MLDGFEPEDRKSLDRVVSRVTDGAVPNFGALLGRWEAFVAEVGSGYELTIYDYTNDLAVRDWLAEVLGQSSAKLATALIAQLEPVDRVFFAETRSVVDPLRLGATGEWWRRVPLSPGVELAGDLESSGHQKHRSQSNDS